MESTSAKYTTHTIGPSKRWSDVCYPARNRSLTKRRELHGRLLSRRESNGCWLAKKDSKRTSDVVVLVDNGCPNGYKVEEDRPTPFCEEEDVEVPQVQDAPSAMPSRRVNPVPTDDRRASVSHIHRFPNEGSSDLVNTMDISNW